MVFVTYDTVVLSKTSFAVNGALFLHPILLVVIENAKKLKKDLTYCNTRL